MKRLPAGRTRHPGTRRLRHLVEYAALRGVVALCRAMPAVVADRFGALLGWFVARVGRPRWRVVTRQLERSFPDADPRWTMSVARRCYRHLGAEMVAMFRLSGTRARRILAQTEVVGLDVLEQARSRGDGVVLVSGHLGNWEVGTAGLVARGYPIDIVVARQRNRLFDDYLNGARARLGMAVIPRESATTGVLAALRAGRTVGIMGDQDARDAGVFVDFFGLPASTARGPAVLALRAGATMATFHTIRLPGWRPRYRIHVESLGTGSGSEHPNSRARGTGRDALDREATVAAVTQAFTRRLEEHIGRVPHQYFWMHRRWKTPPPVSSPSA